MTDQATASQALLRLAEDWTDLLLDLGVGPRAVDHHTALRMVTAMATPFVHPLLVTDTLSDRLAELAFAVTALDRWTNHGTWDAEDDDALGARSEQDRTEFLQRDVDYLLYGLVCGIHPCTACSRQRPVEQWQPASRSQHLCPGHLVVQREQRQMIDHRPQHSGLTVLPGGAS